MAAKRNVDPIKALEYITQHYHTAQRESLLKDVALTELEENLEAMEARAEAAEKRVGELEAFIRQQEAAVTNQEQPVEDLPAEQ